MSTLWQQQQSVAATEMTARAANANRTQNLAS